MSIIAETERLVLRHITLEDADNILMLGSDPEVLKYLHEPILLSTEDAKKVIRERIFPQYDLYGFGRWAVHEKSTGAFTGWCGLKYRSELDEIDLGYRFLQQYWGKGYATEAAAKCLQIGFDQFNIPIIIAHAHVNNTGSLNVIRKLDMQFLRFEEVENCPVETYQAINPRLA